MESRSQASGAILSRATWRTGIVIGLALLGISLADPPESHGQDNVLRIAAVVNDDIISALDLEQRVRLVALSSNLKLDGETRQRLMPQVLRQLIDESLQLQEARRNSVTATENEIESEIENLAQRNNIPPTQLGPFLAQNGVQLQTLRDQIEVQIAWAKFVGRRLSREVEVGEEEIDAELERLRAVADQPQKRVYEVFLGVDNPDEEAEIRANAERLLNQIRNGADFSAIARSFSQSNSAASGGELGWISPGQLPPELDQALQPLAAGMVSAPIRTVTGYHLLYVTDVQIIGRDAGAARISLFQLIERLPQQGLAEAKATAIAQLSAARRGLNSCEDLRRFGDSRTNTNVAAAENIPISDLPSATQQAIESLQPGQTSEPIDTGNSILMVTICDRSDPGISLPDREQIFNRIRDERLELVVRRTLRDLRRAAYIDVRL